MWFAFSYCYLFNSHWAKQEKRNKISRFILDFLHNTGRHSLFSSDLRSSHALVIDGLLYAFAEGEEAHGWK